MGHILHKSIPSTAKKKRGSFSLFMGARRQFEEMPNKKVKSGLKKVLLHSTTVIYLSVTLVFILKEQKLFLLPWQNLNCYKVSICKCEFDMEQ